MSARPDPLDDGVVGNGHAKRRRTDDEPIELDGPIEGEATARQKLERAGFDPDNLTLEAERVLYGRAATPMTYFSSHGDLPMCRYLFVHGAAEDVSTSSGYWFPMFAAAHQSHVDVCQWLYKHGAADDIRRQNEAGYTPIVGVARNSSKKNRQKTLQWLVLKGALNSVTSGHVDRDIVIRDLGYALDDNESLGIRTQLLSLVRDAVQVHATFQGTFLMGTHTSPEYSIPALLHLFSTKIGSEQAAAMIIEDTSLDTKRRIWDELVPNNSARSSALRCFNGLPGIIELVADFVGVMRGRDLRTVRELAGVLETLVFVKRDCDDRYFASDHIEYID